MLSSSITQFSQSISSLIGHLEYLENNKDVVRILNPNTITSIPIKEKLVALKRNISKEKEYNYNANIISLYGYFEQYIEALIEEYVNKLITIVVQFDTNANIIKEQFFSKWEKLYNKITYPKYAYLTEEIMIQLLYEVKIKNQNHLIPEYYYQNGGNYKHSVICDCFKSLGIENISKMIKFYNPLCSYFNCKGIFEQNEDILYEPLNDFVARRNDVAHGNSTSILDLSYFKDYVNFISLYAKSLNMLLDDNLNKLQWENTHSPIININHLYRNKIVEIGVTDCTIEIGDTILIEESNGTYPRYTTCQVESIFKNNQELPEFITYEKETLSLGLSKNVKKNYKLKLTN